MHAAGQIEEIKGDEVLGHVLVFPVTELAKRRFRIIKHTRDINVKFGSDSLMKTVLPSRAEQSSQAASGKFAICLDFAAYFDAFPMHEEVQRRMCFTADGKTYKLTRMPMGQRHSVAIAQGATDVLLSFEYAQGVTSQSCIDNVRFVGPKAGVIETARRFVERCRQAGCTLNELPSSNTAEQDLAMITELTHNKGVWLGAEYDYAAGMQRVAQKSLDKLTTSWRNRASWTYRTFAAHMGLLFFATSICRLHPGSFFEAMKQFRRRSADLTEKPELWDCPLTLSGGEARDLERWTAQASMNPWTPCFDGNPASKVLITDASEWGWGAIFYDVAAGSMKIVSQRWSEGDRLALDVQHSVYAEPEAVFRALCRFVCPLTRQAVAVLSDSTTAVYALGRGYSPSFMVNTIANRCRKGFPNTRLDFYHVAGSLNAVDAYSRGMAPPSYATTFSAVKRMMGTVPNLNIVQVNEPASGGSGAPNHPV